MIELVTYLEVMCASPPTLEERHILVELIVLIGVEQSVGVIVWRCACSSGLRQIRRERVTRVIQGTHTICIPHNVWRRKLPAEVVIVLKEVAKASGGDDLRRDADVSANVVGRVRG